MFTSKRSTARHRTSAALVLASALVLTACGDDTATSDAGSAAEQRSSTPSASVEATTNDADAAFLAGMKPHHEQAVEMSDVVLAANPPAPVAELAQQVKAAQAPEIEQMDQMMAELGHSMADGHRAGDMGEHGGMMSDADMAELMDATGPEAARRYLEGMIEHHKGAIKAAETEIAEGNYEPAVELARKIAKDQAAEITKMEGLLAGL